MLKLVLELTLPKDIVGRRRFVQELYKRYVGHINSVYQVKCLFFLFNVIKFVCYFDQRRVAHLALMADSVNGVTHVNVLWGSQEIDVKLVRLEHYSLSAFSTYNLHYIHLLYP